MDVPRIPLLIALIALAGGCNGRDDATVPDATDAPAADEAPQAPVAPPVVDDPGAVTRYACDADTTVVILRNGGARVSLPGEPDIDLSRIAGSQPPIFTGSSLYFTVGDGQAFLSQGDETNELACRPQ